MPTILLTLTFSLIALFCGLKARRAWLRDTERPTKINRSAVRALESTEAKTPPLSPWAREDTKNGDVARDFTSAELQAALRQRGLIAVPVAKKLTSIYPRPGTASYAVPAGESAASSSGDWNERARETPDESWKTPANLAGPGEIP